MTLTKPPTLPTSPLPLPQALPTPLPLPMPLTNPSTNQKPLPISNHRDVMNDQAEGPANKPKDPRRAACYLDTRRREVSAVGGGAEPPRTGPKGPPKNLKPRDAHDVAARVCACLPYILERARAPRTVILPHV